MEPQLRRRPAVLRRVPQVPEGEAEPGVVPGAAVLVVRGGPGLLRVAPDPDHHRGQRETALGLRPDHGIDLLHAAGLLPVHGAERAGDCGAGLFPDHDAPDAEAIRLCNLAVCGGSLAGYHGTVDYN